LGLVAALGLGGAACLGPLVDDAPPASSSFADPALTPATAPHVEDDPANAPRLASFASRVQYLRGFAAGQPVRYWNVDGAGSSLIAPLFVLEDAAGNVIGWPIIDVLPGEPGYTPWWRRVVVRVTAAYAGEHIWSRAAIEEGVAKGLLEAPRATTTVIDCPVVRRGTPIPVSAAPGARTASTTPAWYRDRRVDLVAFSDTIDVPLESRRMPTFPVYILQRIDSGQPLHEAVTGVDVTGDGRLDASNNVFADRLGGARYSPLWQPHLVRVAADVASIDTARSATVAELAREADLARFVDGAPTPADGRTLTITDLGGLVNCPIQRREGAL
jgi:hypothetical protein